MLIKPESILISGVNINARNVGVQFFRLVHSGKLIHLATLLQYITTCG